LTTVEAVYENGVLRPSEPLPFSEGERVEVTVCPKPARTTGPPADEITRRLREAKTYREWFQATKSLPPDDGGYDIVRALNENRKWAGDRPILPDDEDAQ